MSRCAATLFLLLGLCKYPVIQPVDLRLRRQWEGVNWSHLGKVVSAVLLVAAAVVGITAWLTTLVGLVIAVVGIVLLIVGATVVAVLTRPDKKRAKLNPPETSAGPSSQQPKDKEPESKVQTPKPKPEKDEGPKVTASPLLTGGPRLEPVTRMRATTVRLGEVYGQVASQPLPKPTPLPPTKPPQPSFKEEQLVRKRSEVAAGAVTTLKLAVVKGDYVYGRLREIEGYEFTWAIVDLKNLGLMERGLRFQPQQGERDVATVTIEWTVPSDGPWFLAFDATGKQYVRQVAVELWRRIPQ